MKFWIRLFISMFLLWGNGLQAAELLFTTPKGAPIGMVSTRVLQYAYDQLSIPFSVAGIPGARGIQMANDGESDGEVFRVPLILKKFKNLLMIPVPVQEIQIMVFTKNLEFPVTGWESLQPYEILVLRGFKQAEFHLQGMKVAAITTNQQMFQMLSEERADLIVSTRHAGLFHLQQLGMQGIKELEPSLSSQKVYHFLHKKHENLVPQVTQVLEQMETSGKIQEITQQFFAELREQS